MFTREKYPAFIPDLRHDLRHEEKSSNKLNGIARADVAFDDEHTIVTDSD